MAPGRLLLMPALLALALTGLFAERASAAPCDPPIANAIVCENSKPGNPPSEWDVSGAGDSNIQGFATDISVDQGQTVHFKINTPSSDYRLDIYRMGYYGGNGARKVATVQPSASLPQTQPACLTQSATGLVDCGNWRESASWAVPADAVSGHLLRQARARGRRPRAEATSSSSSATTTGTPTSSSRPPTRPGRPTTSTAATASTPAGPAPIRPRLQGQLQPPVHHPRHQPPRTSPFNAEYPMVRWLERNGYDVSYFTGVDTDRRGAEILEHKAFLSVGHDEYWSGGQRANVEAARDAGVNLAFFSGNEIFWKTRWENSIDGSATPTTARWSATRRPTPTRKIDPTARPGPGPGAIRASARPPTAAAPRTR